jgi:DNA-binding MarR family transcriptional regulator
MKKTPEIDKYYGIRLGNQLCFPLYACAKEIVRLYRKPLAEIGLTYTQYVVMMVLWEYGTMSEGELGKHVYLDSGTLAPLLKRLEKQGLISRTRPENNERKLFISLTKEGEALKDRAVNVPVAMQGCIPMPGEKLIMLRDLLNQALECMQKEDDE